MDMGTRGYVYALGKRLRGREERGCPKFRMGRSRRPRGWRDGKCAGHWAGRSGGQQGAQVVCGRRGGSSRGGRGMPRPGIECCHWLESANQQGSVSLRQPRQRIDCCHWSQSTNQQGSVRISETARYRQEQFRLVRWARLPCDRLNTKETTSAKEAHKSQYGDEEWPGRGSCRAGYDSFMAVECFRPYLILSEFSPLRQTTSLCIVKSHLLRVSQSQHPRVAPRPIFSSNLRQLHPCHPSHQSHRIILTFPAW